MYVFPAFGGSTSDQDLVERSKLDMLCNDADEITSDKGFDTQDLFADDSLKITIAKFFKMKDTMSQKQLSYTTYKYLLNGFSSCFLSQSDVCAILQPVLPPSEDN